MAIAHNINSKALLAAGYRPLHAGDDFDYKFSISGLDNGDLKTARKVWFTAKEGSSDPDSAAVLWLDSDAAAEIEILTETAILVRFRGLYNGQGIGKVTDDLLGPYLYDIQVKDEADKIVTVIDGTLKFLPNVTRTPI